MVTMNERGSTEFFSQKQQEDGYRKIKYSTCAEVIIIIEINMTPPIQETEGQPAAMSVESSTSSVTAEANVGLPVSTSDEEEDSSSGDEALTAAGDDLCRSLQKEALTPKRKTAHGGDLNIEANSTTELSLEERVQDLETKLATLSRILQQQQRLSVRSLLTRSPSNSQRSLSPHPRLQVPDLSSGNDQNHGSDYCHPPDSPPHSQQQQRQQHTNSKGMVPYLESPAPFDDCSPRERKKHQRQRLSFHLLYDGNEDNLNRGDDEDHLQKSETTNNSSNPHMMPNSNHCQDSNSNANSENGASEPEQDNHMQSENNDKREEEEESHPLKSDASPQWKSEKKSHINSTIVDTAVSVIANEAKGQFKSKKEEDSSEKLERSGTSLDKDQLKKNKSSYVAATTNSNQQQQQQQQQQAGQDSASSITNAGSSHSANAIATTTSTTATTGLLQPLLLSKDKRSKWLDHLNSFQESNHDVDVQMQEFIKVPGSVEKTLSFGLLICIDSFLYVCTILPIRFAWSCVLLSLHYFFKWTKKPAGNYQFHRRHTYQLIQVSIIFLIYQYVLLPISIGKLYHWIRGQAMIKLYVLIAIVEVFDRLMCSLGQDCLDSMYWNTTRRPRSSRMLISVSVVVVYTAMHSLILLLHVATLNVAMNSADEALLALLIAGNFAEIKSTVFKKYNKSSLFKIVAGDICERFKLALFLGIVLLLNFCQGMDSRKMSDYQRIAAIVWMSELLCDWLKHAFITKFNFIPSSVYPEYALLLAGDVTGIGHEGVNLDHSHAVVKRIGFAQMPLVCIMARLAREAGKYMTMRVDMNTISLFRVVLGGSVGWLLLLGLKIFLGAYLQRTSLAKLHAAPELSQAPLKQKQQ